MGNCASGSPSHKAVPSPTPSEPSPTSGRTEAAVDDAALWQLLNGSKADEATCTLDHPMYGTLVQHRTDVRRRAARRLKASEAALPRIIIDTSACEGGTPPRRRSTSTEGNVAQLTPPQWGHEVLVACSRG